MTVLPTAVYTLGLVSTLMMIMSVLLGNLSQWIYKFLFLIWLHVLLKILFDFRGRQIEKVLFLGFIAINFTFSKEEKKHLSCY